MAKAKITGTLGKGSSAGTFTISKIASASDNSIGYVYNSDTTALLSTADGTYSGYGSDVKVLNASAVAAKLALDISVSGNTLTTVTAGKGNDTISVLPGSKSGLIINSGAGRDVVSLSSGTTVTLADFDAGKDVIRFGTANPIDTNDINIVANSGKDLTITLGSASNKTSTITLKNGLGKKITIQNGSGVTIYEDTTNLGENVMKTITDSSAGSVVGAKSPVIDASARKKAIVINASTDTGVAASYNQTILGGAAADSITAADHTKTTITGGKGADVFYIGSDTGEIWITDYTAGDTKTADKIYLKDGLYFGTDTGYVDGEVILYGSKAANGSSKDVTVHLGTSAVWNQVNPAEAKSLVWVTNKADLASIAGTAAYSNPKEVVITDKAIKYAKGKGEIDLPATLEAAKESGKATDATFQISTANRAISTDTGTTNLINFSNIAGPELVTAYPNLNITGSKGKDTIYGGGSATLDGFNGNDMIIAGEADTGTGGAGNDTLRGAGANAVLTGGAGNDVFALAAEGGSDVIISDYYAGRANANQDKNSVTADKKEFGSDKIVVVNDKYNAAAGIGRAEVDMGSTKFSDGGNKASDLTIAVTGQIWVPGATVKAHEADMEYVHSSIRNTLTNYTGAGEEYYDYASNSLKTSTGANSGTQVFQAGHFEDGEDDGTYKIKDALGRAVTFTEGGTTYQQTVSADTSFTVTQSFHAALAPDAVEINGGNATKALKIVGGSKTTKITGGSKNDTLVGSDSDTALTGGNGNDVYMGSGYVADYNANGKDKIVYSDQDGEAAFSGFGFVTGKTDEINAGNLTIKLGTGDITFNAIHNTKTQAKLKSNANATTAWKVTEKKVTDAMIRGFGTSSSVVAFAKGSTHAFTYSGIDSGVAVLDASNTGKNTYIENTADYVQSIVGSAKNDTIYAGTFQTPAADFKYYGGQYASGTGVYDSLNAAHWGQVTVTTGKGNDLIIIDGSNAYITDFTASKTTVKNGAITKVTGDAIAYSDAFEASDVSVASSAFTTVEGDQVQGTENLSFTFGTTYETKDDVIITSSDDSMTLKGQKGKQAFFYDGSNLDEGYMATLNNLHEYVVAAKGAKKGDKIDASKATQVGKGGVVAADITIIDASAHGKGAEITAGDYVKTIYAGKGADTVIAGSDTTVYTGNGADVLTFDSVVAGKSGGTFTIADYALTDKISLGGGVAILRASTEGLASSKGAKAVYNKKGTTVVGTNNYSDVTLTLSTEGGTGGLTVKFTDLIANSTNGLKVTRQLGTTNQAFALDYFNSDVTVAAADGNVIDFSGSNAKNVRFAANRTKSVTLQGANAGTTVFGTTGKAAITYIAGDAEADKATVYGSSKADIYQGSAASDVVIFSAGGNNTVLGGGTGGSTFTFGSGNEVAVVKASDTFNINTYTAGKDVIILDTVFSSADFQGASKVKTAADGRAVNDYVLTFGTGAATLASIGFGTELASGNKVTIKLGSSKNGKLVAGSTIFQGGFGTNMSFADADGTTINAQYNPFATAITAEDATKVKKIHYLTVGTNSDTKVTAMTGGAGADTLVANYGVATLTGGKGNDTFVIESSTTVTITDFNTGKDVLNLKTADSAFKLEDYGKNYSFSGNDLIVSGTTAGAATVVVKNAVSSGATAAIRYIGSDDQSKNGIVLHDKIDIALAKTVAKTDFTDTYFSDTKTFDASKVTGAIKFTAGNSFTKFTAGKGGSEVNLNADNQAVTYASGAGADKVTLGGGKTTFTFEGGSDELSKATNANYSIGVASGLKADSASVNSTGTEVTVKFKKGTADAGSLKITANASTAFTFSSDWVRDDSSAASLGGGGNDSSTTVYTWYATKYVQVAGISDKLVYDNSNKLEKQKDKPTQTINSPYMERSDSAYDVITAAETLFGASEFEEITPAKAEVDVTSTSESEVDSVIKGVTATFAGVGKQRQDK